MDRLPPARAPQQRQDRTPQDGRASLAAAHRSQWVTVPELTDYLDGLERLGVPVVLMRPKRDSSITARLYLLRTARNRVRKAARKAGLPDWLSLASCRHGGLTELGDAELTEQGVLALSGHKSPSAARLYVKRTEAQRVSAARKRRAWVEAASKQEQEADKSRNEAPARMSE